jgi:signal transduction histidine kinase
MGWVAYVIAWLATALFWALASASSAERSPLETLPYGLLAMGSGAVMGVGVWRLTNRVAWDWRAPSFYAAHGTALAIYSVVYSTSWMWPDLVTGRIAIALAGLRTSPVLIWSLLMGSWLYLVVAGLSYAVRAHRRVRAQEAAAAEARLLAQQAQLVALRAQINPHFLFNALHSVGALVASDPVRADKALECLGDLLRYALGTEHEVLFAEEWKFTQNYLAFEQLRFGDRLRVNADADAAALSIMVPPLILQPLVENAVRHGIAERPEGGCVELRARVEDARLVLRVTDDGRGDTGGAGEGLGQKSVRQRLAALYGDRATLSIDSKSTGFAVTIGLPLPAHDLRVAV